MYDAAGNKLKKTVFPAGGTETYKYYADGVEFDNMYWAPTKFYNEEGSYSYNANSNAWNYEYSLRDHLGNTRVVFSDLNGDGSIDLTAEISQINHFYPYGMNMEGNWNGASGNYKMQFNGNEWNSDLGLNWNDHNARWYDPAIGRWGGIDPLAEAYHQDSPYSFGASSPMVFADPSGMGPDECYSFKNKWSGSTDLDKSISGTGNIQSLISQMTQMFGPGPMGTPDNPFTLNTIEITYSESQQEKQDRALRWNKAFLAPIPSVKTANDLSELFKGGILFSIGFIDAGVIYGGTYSMSKIVAMNAAETSVSGVSNIVVSNVANSFNIINAFKNAISLYKGELTNAGRAVTKHPEYFGFDSYQSLSKVYRTPKALNNLGSSVLKNIIRNGVKTTGAGGRWPNGWVTYTLPDGLGASWGLDGTFIGFRGIK